MIDDSSRHSCIVRVCDSPYLPSADNSCAVELDIIMIRFARDCGARIAGAMKYGKVHFSNSFVLTGEDAQVLIELIVKRLMFELRKNAGEETFIPKPGGTRRVIALKPNVWRVGCRRRQAAVNVLVIEHAEGKLLEIVGALGPAGCFTSGLHGRQYQSDKRTDDGYDDKKLDKREAASHFVAEMMIWQCVTGFIA